MGKRKTGLRFRLIFVAFLAASPALFLIAYDAEVTRRSAIEQAEQTSLELARTVSHYHQDLNRQAHNLLLVLARDPLVISDDHAACNAHLADLLFNANPEPDNFFNFVAINLDGDIYCSSRAGTPGNMHVRDRDYYWHVISHKTVFTGQYVFGKIIRAPVVPVAGPIMVNGDLKGVMLVTINLAWIAKTMAERLPPDAVLRFYDHNGTILTRVPNHDEAVGGRDDVFERVATGKDEGTFVGLNHSGDERLYAYARLPYGSQTFYVAVDRPTGTLFAEARAALRRGLAELALLTLAVLVTACTIGKPLILRSVTSLTDAVRLMTAGDLSTRVNVRRDGEIGQLGDAFNEMAGALERNAHDAAIREKSLREANVAKGNFLSMVSHEFRMPLAIIHAASQLIALFTRSDNVAQDEVGKIERAVRRMTDLIDVYLADDRLESNATTLILTDVDLGDVLTKLCDERELIAQKQPLTVQCDVTGRIEGDPAMLRIVFSNLIDNAMKFSPLDSPVTIKVSGTQDGVLVCVIDHGPGIRQEDLDFIFEKYYRSPETNRVHGAGLGLYIVKRIVELHGGSITVKSHPGAGATFIVWLPQKAAVPGRSPSIPGDARHP